MDIALFASLATALAAYQDVSDASATKATLAAGEALQANIWTKAVTASQAPGAAPQAAMLILPALNELIDITATREMATLNHPPVIVFLLLIGLSLIGALLVGYDVSPNTRRTWFHTVVFAAVLSLKARPPYSTNGMPAASS